MQSICDILELLERPKVEEHAHLAGILCQLRTVGYKYVEYTHRHFMIFSGPNMQDLEIEVPFVISWNLKAIFGDGIKLIDELLEHKHFKIGKAIYEENIKQNHDDGHTIRHKPNLLKARISKRGGEYIATLNGIIKVNPGDWIITGVNGEQYPCDPEIFKELYDVVK